MKLLPNTGNFLFRSLGLALVIIFGVFSILGSGGGSDGVSDDGGTPNAGWVTISYPTTDDTYNTDNSPQYLSGEAFISPTWWRCCSGDASDTGVSVIWRNETTGQTGPASQYVRYCWFLGLYLCDHTWSASIPIIEGNNNITITASDPSGNTGIDKITIIRSPDSVSPTVITTIPAIDETEVPIYTNVIARFNESINPISITDTSFTLLQIFGNDQVKVNGAFSVSESGTEVTFNPVDDLEWNRTYVATLTTAITDLSGNPLNEDYVWTFYTGAIDTTPPEVVATIPLANSIDVPPKVSLTIKFSESMYPSSINTDTILLFNAANDRVEGTVSQSGDIVTFTPLDTLADSSQYNAMVTTGVMDMFGNALESDYSWTFTTGVLDVIPPTVTSTSPLNNDTGIAIETLLTITFSEAMDETTINASSFLLEDSQGNPIDGTVSGGNTFRPYTSLELNETYTATITTAVTDNAGNPLAVPYSWRFTTTEDGVGSWVTTSTLNAPSPRRDATAIWTGSEMIIWGGYDGTYLNTGGRYDPITDSWQPISTVNAPGGCSTPVSVWTGQEMIVWCGRNITGNRGGRYNPVTDTWQTISTLNAPGGLSHSTAVWTGAEMIVWGGYGTTYSNSGGRYNPSTDTWQPTTRTGAPEPRVYHTAVWSGDEMIIWGGDGGPFVFIGDTGGRYDPVTDSWRDVSSSGFLNNKVGHVASWTGSEMVVWNGNTNSGSYNPLTDSWGNIATIYALVERDLPLSAWTGTQMIVWGGKTLTPINSGGSYNPVTDSWLLMTFAGAPSGRSYGVSVWTGTEFIIWGGQDWSWALTNTGGRYQFP